jgi:hypothetical protein
VGLASVSLAGSTAGATYRPMEATIGTYPIVLEDSEISGKPRGSTHEILMLVISRVNTMQMKIFVAVAGSLIKLARGEAGVGISGIKEQRL